MELQEFIEKSESISEELEQLRYWAQHLDLEHPSGSDYLYWSRNVLREYGEAARDKLERLRLIEQAAEMQDQMWQSPDLMGEQTEKSVSPEQSVSPDQWGM